MEHALPPAHRALAVCAHPDDESFGLGAIIAAYTERLTGLAVLCFTHGEASSHGSQHDDLASVRAAELRCASEKLGVAETTLLDHPDGRLTDSPLNSLKEQLTTAAHSPDVLLVFDEWGITGHPDHRHATRAAVDWARERRIPVLAWSIPLDIADTLNDELGSSFIGRPDDELDIVLNVDRARQYEAIDCHRSQSIDNPVLWRRLELQGRLEHLRYAYRPPR